MKIKLLSALIFAFLLLISCSDNDNGTDTNVDPDESEITIILSGEINNEYNSMLTTVYDLPNYISDDDENISAFQINVMLENASYIFYLGVFDYQSDDGTDEKAYDVEPVGSSGDFTEEEGGTVLLVDINNTISYVSNKGVIEITRYNSEYVTGDFKVTLVNPDDQTKTITAEGSFSYIK